MGSTWIIDWANQRHDLPVFSRRLNYPRCNHDQGKLPLGPANMEIRSVTCWYCGVNDRRGERHVYAAGKIGQLSTSRSGFKLRTGL